MHFDQGAVDVSEHFPLHFGWQARLDARAGKSEQEPVRLVCHRDGDGRLGLAIQGDKGDKTGNNLAVELLVRVDRFFRGENLVIQLDIRTGVEFFPMRQALRNQLFDIRILGAGFFFVPVDPGDVDQSIHQGEGAHPAAVDGPQVFFLEIGQGRLANRVQQHLAEPGDVVEGSAQIMRLDGDELVEINLRGEIYFFVGHKATHLPLWENQHTDSILLGKDL